jgi:hypothetical protein
MNQHLAIRENYEALDAAIGSDIDGEPLRFKDGVFLQGFDKIEVEMGTVFRIAPTSVQDGFMRWENGKPVDWKLREWFKPGQLPIYRDTLGDMDESQWPDGKDPWAYTLLLAMKDAEGVLFKFSTSGVSAANSVKRTLREWRRERDKHPGLVPVVALGSSSYVHKVHKSTVRFPTFEIVGWEPWDESERQSLSYETADDPRTQVSKAYHPGGKGRQGRQTQGAGRSLRRRRRSRTGQANFHKVKRNVTSSASGATRRHRARRGPRAQ